MLHSYVRLANHHAARIQLYALELHHTREQLQSLFKIFFRQSSDQPHQDERINPVANANTYFRGTDKYRNLALGLYFFYASYSSANS